MLTGGTLSAARFVFALTKSSWRIVASMVSTLFGLPLISSS